VWDAGNVKAVEKAIRDAGLGLNPQTDGTNLRLPIPPLTEERRNELKKLAGKYTEAAKVSVRNVRRDAMDAIKKDKGGSEDEQKRLSDEIQKMTDTAIEKIDKMLSDKETDIMKV
jgi:ribosome recycling factor